MSEPLKPRIDPEIVVRVGTEARVVPLAALSAVLRQRTNDIRRALEIVIFGPKEEISTRPSRFTPPAPSRGQGRMEEETIEVVVVGPSIHIIQKENNSDHTNHSESEMVRTMVDGEVMSELEPDAIALALGDEANLTAITLLVRGLEPSLVREALDQTLAVPAVRLRSNRAALFTAIVRRLKRTGSNLESHAA